MQIQTENKTKIHKHQIFTFVVLYGEMYERESPVRWMRVRERGREMYERERERERDV